MYPLKRNRRLRTSAAVRSLVREQSLSVDDFIVPLFVVEGSNIKEEILHARLLPHKSGFTC